MGPTRERNCALMENVADRGDCELANLEPGNSTPVRLDAAVTGIYARDLDAGNYPNVGGERTTVPDVRDRNMAAAACAAVIERGDCPLYELLAPRSGAEKQIVEQGKSDPGERRLKIVR